MRDPRTMLTRHPKLVEANTLLETERMDRREFIRLAALVGVGVAAASTFVGMPQVAAGQEEANFPFGDDDPNARTGGILRVSMQVQPMDDPALYSWVQMSNQTRHMNEHLTYVGADNVARPMLATGWQASDDLTQWKFNLRPGVKWHNGDDFTADDVIHNFGRWLDPELGSPNVGLSTLAAMSEEKNGVKVMRENAIEKLDDFTIQLNLSKPVLSVPEDLYNYTTALVHPSFVAPLSTDPIGTGPYTLDTLEVGKKCTLRRVTHMTNGEPFVYWGGKTYLDEIHYFNQNTDLQLATFARGQVDTIYEFTSEQFERARELPGTILAAKTAQTGVCRMQITQAPFDNKLVRQAIVKSVDASAYLDELFQGRGEIGENHHVSPIHPEYFALPKLGRDLEGAKALLRQAGYEDGLEIEIQVGNTNGEWEYRLCQILKRQLAEVNIQLNIKLVPTEVYWKDWDKAAFGLTGWVHRPLGTMNLSLAYRSGVPWNETHYSNPEFDAALDKAEAILDVEERRVAMEEVEQILQDAALMVQPVWRPVFTMQADHVHGLKAHPTQYHQFNKVWIEG